MKKIIFLFIFLFCFSSFFVASVSVASADVSVFIINAGTDTFYPNEINKLVLRFEIDEAPNTLEAITIQNIATRPAENITDIAKISVWLDNGDGFFISETETKLGEAVWDSADSWDFSNIEHSFSEKITLWITADISHTATNSRQIRMQIPSQGISLSDKTGPSSLAMNASSQVISTAGGVCGHDVYSPSVPTDFQVENTGQGNEIQLDWTNPSELDFSHITIYRSQESGIKGDLLDSVSDSPFTDTGLQNGTEYYYKIEAIDQCGNSSIGTEQMSAIALLLPVVEPEEPEEPEETEEPEELEEPVATEEPVETEESEDAGEPETVKPISEMTVAEIKQKITEIQQQIIALINQLIALLTAD